MNKKLLSPNPHYKIQAHVLQSAQNLTSKANCISKNHLNFSEIDFPSIFLGYQRSLTTWIFETLYHLK